MLILDRKIGEEIYINNGKIKITVLYEKNGLIGIGVRAPSEIDIDRKEVFIRKYIQKLDQENKQNNATLKCFTASNSDDTQLRIYMLSWEYLQRRAK